jgi:hypothetical protein
MAGPFRCVNMVVTINIDSTDYVVGVVEGLDIDLSYTGGTEPVYGTRTPRHSAGSKKATFTLTRWYYADAGQEDLLYRLFRDELTFTLKGHLLDPHAETEVSNTSITITGCRLYRWRPRTGGADDIIGEEAQGQGTGWTSEIAPTSP